MNATDSTAVHIVLGGTGAIGREVASELISSGARVVLGGRDPAKLEESAGQLSADSIQLDASVPGSIETAIIEVSKRHGRVDGIANCIGSILLKPAHLTSLEEFDDILRTNLCSSFEAVRGAAKVMRKSGGSVVLVSTAAAGIGIPSHEAIAAAKAGIEGLARSAAATYARSKIRFNVVAPGLVRSEMSRSIWENDASAAASLDMHALGRLGEPCDVAAMITMLLTPKNDWITGQVIGIDGGLSCVLPRARH